VEESIMTTEQERNETAQREVDVDALLQAIQRHTSGDIQEFMQASAPRESSCRQLADAFELDIHDCRCTESDR
jgi:hypothetical protein